ncbi:PadR family transcriptional regulator [Lysinibacillus sp. M3]|uniref:PadR family transcriptional regulator n=1 Tax=Lysinibacillus zambalensis TaxID=3160866 RepID=A0ABV1MUT2_9BACI
MENIQLKKGVLELCVLMLVRKKDHYGYELVMSISKYFEISEGSIYPLLHRMTKETLFTTYLLESKAGPPRKYYKITEKGVQKLEKLVDEWKLFVSSVQDILDDWGDENSSEK